MKRPVAIVGAACRFPGDAVDLDGYWRLLDGRIDAVREVPVERWDPAKWLDPNPDVIGKTYSARGTFVSDIDRFDAWFFQISPREAKSISPEQRLLLEVSWEAIENAGLLPERIREAGAGVFVGVAPTVYGDTVEGAIPPRTDVYAVTGRLTSFGAGRLSYVLGFRGPSVAIDTACSSALVALHLACRSLQAGECAVAVASAVNVLLNPISYVDMSRLRALSRSGACRAFDAMADGYVRGEGCGAVVLKLLDDALRDGDHVLAVIRGSAVNHDGASSGLTVPSRHAQEELLRAALRDAELAPSDIDYVEAHGTGTPLGDPIEALALGTVFGEGRPADRPLLFGSVKTNLGHLESAAGMASLLKLIVALRHEQLPAQLHLQTPNPAIPWAALPMRVAAEPHAWPRRSGRPRLAGLSAFGISGTNAHIILEEPPLTEQTIAPVATVHSVMRAEPSTLPVLISAKSKAALQAQAARIQGFFEAHPDTRLVDLANSLATTRTHFEERAVVVADDRAALLEGLTAVAKGTPCPNVTTGQVQLPGKLVFVFPGQGSQWTEMAHRLLDTSSVFREHIERCAQALAPHVDWSLVEVLLGASGAPSLERIDVVQPVLFAMAVSLAAVWRSLGIEPDVVVGHSQGEIAAACVAGALSLEDAARVVALRALVLAKLDGKGAMAAVELPLPELGERLARFGERLCVSAVNGPRSMIVSGEPQALDELLAELQAAEIFARKVRVDYASHCPQIEAIREDFFARVGSICPRASNVPLCSTVTGDIVEGAELDVDYWYRNCRQEVRFADAIQKLISSGHCFFVEISAHPVLTLAINANIEASGKEAATVGSLRRDQGDWPRFMLSLGELHSRGYPVDWTAFFSRFDPRRLTLPTYAFQRKRFWLEPPKTKGADNAPVGVTAGEHPLVGAVVALAESDGVLLTGQLSLAKQRWLRDHAVFDSAVLPATGFLELALAAAEHVGVDGVDELTIEVPLVLPQDGAIQFQLWVGAKEETGRRPWSLHGRLDKAGEDAAWIRHATGLVGPSEPPAGCDLRAWPPSGATTVPVEGFYERLAAAGLRYGESFRGLTAIWRAGSDLYAEVRLPEGSIREASDFALHPALLDAALHPLALLHEVSSDVALPFSWTGVSLHATGASTLRVRISPSDEHGSFALELADGSGEPVASVESLRTRPAARDQVRGAAPATTLDSLYRVEWTALNLASANSATSARSRRARWALCGDDSFALAGRLERSGIALEEHEVLAGLHGSSASVVLLSRLQQNAEHLAEAARAATHEVLAIVQAWLADATFASKQLVIVTRRSVATRMGETVRDLAHAAVWGLVRSAQSEHPDRAIVLLDLDEDADVGLLPAALATGEPQLAIRKEGVFVPRLMRAGAVDAVQARALDPDGTVLITGGTGVLGALFARHLVREHGARHLLLTSRNGAASPGADSLQRELEAAGAHVTIAACDVANRDALANLLATIAPEHPLGAVVHAAGVLDDGVIEALTPERIDRVFEPKVDAAVHLHELTAQLDLSAFVLFSSVAGVSGGPGQGNYAAANAFLDALAQHRHARGLRASSLAWGYWAERSGMTVHLTQADLSRLARLGIERLSTEQGRFLFDVALSRPEPALVLVRINRSALTAAKLVPPLLRALVRPARRAAGTHSPGSGSSLSDRLATLSESDQARTVLALVRAETAVVLGARPESIDAKSALKEFGLDSLMAVELRNRLAATTGLRLPATLLFDHPTLGAVARYVGEKLRPAAPVAAHEPLQVAAADEDPIVVIAMSCRYPGGVRSPEELWQLVVDGKDAITDFPTNRGWPNVAEIYDPDPNARGKSYVHNGGFLHDADLFDPGVFGISQREALTIDPQHRLLLEASWEAFERAGIAPSSLDGSPTGVFVGVMFSDYGARLAHRAEEHEGYLGLGSAPSVASGRIAYTFGLQGPAVTLDTACSSSLVALHLASQALRLGECSIALAGGVSVMATPGMFIEFSRQRGLAPDGRCKPFAASADGTAWSEGVGMLLLERLSDARRHGHPVLAVIRGSAVNQDGKSQGLTAPNGPSQQRVIAQALTSAGLSPGDIDVVEAHGTGTALGDPIEAEALLATYGEGHTAERPLWLGSVKSNIGHTQAAAGAAGIMKMVLALEHGVLPKSLSAESPSPHVDWSPRTVRLLNEPVSWQPNGKPRRAGISAFGISGTNAHVIIEGPPSTSSVEQGGQRVEPTVLPFVVSARTESALRVQATQLRAHVEARPEERLADIAHSLATTRAHLEWRAVIVASDRSQFVEGLASLAESRPSGAVVCGDAKHVGKLAVLFAGQGSQYVGMGQALYESVPAFREAFDVVCMELDRHLSRPLREVVFASSDSTGASLLHETGFTQPALFALEVALYRLLEGWGITPDFLLGHSVGEISAAHVSGVLDLADACALVAARGRLMQALPPGGTMVSLRASEEEVAPVLAGREDRVSIALLNGPLSTVIAGDEEAVLDVARHFESLGRKTSRLMVSHAFHSPRMDGMLEAFRDVVQGLRFRTPRIPIVSNVTGKVATAEELASPDYWVRHVRRPVRFSDGMRSLEAEGTTTFLELGPRGVLSAMGQECLVGDGVERAVFLPALRDERPELGTLVSAMAGVHARGHALDWNAFFAPFEPQRVALPTYAFERKRFWLDAPRASLAGIRDAVPATVADSLYRVEWTAVSVANVPNAGGERAPWALLGGDSLGLAGRLEQEGVRLESHGDRAALHGSAADVVLLCRAQSKTERLEEGARAVTRQVLAIVQAWLADADVASKQLVIVTRRAVATRMNETAEDLAHAAAWGLVRSAQFEHPDRSIVLVDLDDDADVGLLPSALTLGEPQVALRKEGVFVPRLIRAGAVEARTLDLDGTVLITGGTGMLGALFARHLVSAHGARHVLLTSRQGMASPGADRLQRELEAAGAHVTIAACDVADRDALAKLLGTIDRAHPLRAIVHAAGVLDDGVIEALTPERIDRVFVPKVDAAVHLHELTEHLDLSAFVLFSSVAGVAGGPGQGNYAAANAFLDALAQHRRGRGLPASSLAWGYWEERSALTAHLRRADLSRFARMGIRQLSTQEGLALFDLALSRPEPTLVPIRLDWSAIGSATVVPPLLRALVRSAVSARSALAERLVTLPQDERARVVFELVRTEIAIVLGTKPESIDGASTLKDFGLDSLMAVELRNRLAAATGLRLSATLLFDHPTPAALGRYVEEKLRVHPSAVMSPRQPRPVIASDDDPIVIVAMSCRFPGGVRSPEELWQLVLEGKDAIGDFPTNRGWPKLDELYDPDPEARGKSYVRQGGFLHDADQFDSAFFGINQREAMTIDPQHRLLLETSWEAFERAGIAPASLLGSTTGVFVGLNYNGYGVTRWDRAEEYEGYLGIGSAPSVASGRIAYTFGLQGPAMTVDTACSSSLVALHLACQAVRNGECSIALAGGVSVMATPATFIEFSRQRGLSPDARCKAFAAGADGTAWSEGVGVLLVERLSDARRNGHPVLAVIRGSAVNQDGKSQGLTAPNGPAQRRVIEQALTSAGLSPSEVDVVEAHGTGTALGDPIEAEALLATYGEGHTAERPLWLGSVKTNIGHTQAAAGAAGIMKMVLALEHGILPKTLFAESPSPHVDWSPGTIRLLNEPVSWTPNGKPRRAAISSFGISGTNAHVIVEGPPAVRPERQAVESVAEPALPFVLSARSENALSAQALQLRAHIEAHPEERLVDIAHALATTRTHFERRAVVVSHDRATLVAGLAALARGEAHPNVVARRAQSGGKLAFVFPGHGPQWTEMAHRLLDTSSVFREQIERCDRALAPHVEWSLVDVLRGSDGAPSVERLDVVQPALFAMSVALAAVWRSIGVEPDAVVGHSLGEIAAACVAGALSLEEAAKVVALRGLALAKLEGKGMTVAVELSARDVGVRLARYGERITIAGVNGPKSTLASGEPQAMEELLSELSAADILGRKVRIDYAAHGSQVDTVRADFIARLGTVNPSATAMGLYSTVTGKEIEGTELDAEYWFENCRKPVCFADAIQNLLSSGYRFFVEASPHPVLTLTIDENIEASGRHAVAIASLRRGQGDWQRLMLSLGELHVAGHPIDWKVFYARFEPRSVSLPTYAFDRKRFWIDALEPEKARVGRASRDLVGRQLSSPLGLIQFEAEWGGAMFSLDDAKSRRLPNALFLELALQAGSRAAQATPMSVVDLRFEHPLVLGATEIATVQTVLSTRAGGEFFFQVFSRKGNASASSGEWVEHASGRLTKEGATPDGQHAREEKTRAFEMAEVVDFMGDARFVMREVWQEGTAACGTIDVPSAAALQRFGAWPFALEAALQLTALLDCPVDPSRVGLLTGDLMGCEEVRGHRSLLPPTFMCRVRHDDGIGKRGGTSARYTVELFGGAGEPTAMLAGLEWGAVAVRERPASKTFEERLSEVEQHILERLRELSGYEVSNDSSFDIQSLGLDSLSLMTFMRGLEKRYGVRVPVSKMFGAHQKTNADRVRDLARFLLGQEELDASAERESRTAENGAIDYAVLEDAKEVAWPNDQHPLAGIATRRLWRLSEELTIEVAEAGEGPPLVLLPPFACELTVYSAAIRRLKDHHRVIAINYPGYGASSFSEPDATLEAIAAQVKAILVAMKVREPHVLGWSLGGFVAQLLALGPLRDARSLVLVSTTARLDPADSMSGAEELWRQLHTDLETGLRRCQDDSEREAARRAVFGERTFGLSLWAHYGGLVASFDITHSLHEIRVPTLLIHGSNDLPVPLGYAERTHGAIAGSELLVLPEAGHYIPVLAPDVFVDLLTKWTSRFQ